MATATEPKHADHAGYVDFDEYIDFQLTAAARRVPVEIGKRLAARGLIEAVDDIIHLTFDELRATLTSQPPPDRRGLVAERAAEMLTLAAFEPPVAIGTRPPSPQPDDAPGATHGAAVCSQSARGGNHAVVTLRLPAISGSP